MNKIELSTPVWILKNHGLYNNLSWEFHKRGSTYKCGSKRRICVFQKKFPSFVLIQTLCSKKELKWFPSVATEINFVGQR